ncbi:MAG: ACP phosphodiesterase, partial [Flavobacteriales bacterium]
VVAKGILLHRHIDAFTDEHPRTMESKEQLHPYHGKWAGVVIDILNDHFLATEWERYSPKEGLRPFAVRMHRTLQEHRSLMLQKDRSILDRMVQDEWLLGYQHLNGLERAFYGLSKRTGEKNFLNAPSTLKKLGSPLRSNFHSFFPDLIEHVQNSVDHEKAQTRPPSYR